MCSSLHCTGKHLQVSMKHFTCLLCVHCVHANNNFLIRKLKNKPKLNKWSETIGTYIRCDNPITDFIWKYTLFYMHLPVNICKVVFVDKNSYNKKRQTSCTEPCLQATYMRRDCWILGLASKSTNKSTDDRLVNGPSPFIRNVNTSWKVWWMFFGLNN